MSMAVRFLNQEYGVHRVGRELGMLFVVDGFNLHCCFWMYDLIKL